MSAFDSIADIGGLNHHRRMVCVAGEELPAKEACITCSHVLAGQRIERVSRDADGDWQFLCGLSEHSEADARVLALSEVVELDSRIAALSNFDLGEARAI